VSARRPSRRTTRSRGRSPQRGCPTALTAASATSGGPRAMFSSTIELIHSPPDLIRSFARSVIST
jgi:hypothetical protein